MGLGNNGEGLGLGDDGEGLGVTGLGGDGLGVLPDGLGVPPGGVGVGTHVNDPNEGGNKIVEQLKLIAITSVVRIRLPCVQLTTST